MTLDQISVFIENKYGKLSEILALLAKENIRVVAATVADTSEYGILRLIVTDKSKAYKVLNENNVSVNMAEVLAIVSDSSVNNFARTLDAFTKSGLSIEYMYGFSMNGKTVLILRPNNTAAACNVVNFHHIKCLNENDLANL